MTTAKKEKIQERLQLVFRDVFDDDDIVISEKTTATDIDEWDSLRHISLIVSVEKEFSIRLSASEIGSLKNVGEMMTYIMERTE
jgi:acyl carrier protein